VPKFEVPLQPHRSPFPLHSLSLFQRRCPTPEKPLLSPDIAAAGIRFEHDFVVGVLKIPINYSSKS
jgi:hypothetical protein